MKKKYIFLYLLLIVFLAGCDLFNKKADNNPEPNSVLVSYERVTDPSITAATLDFLLDQDASFNNNELQNATKFSINVYKVLYRTTYKGIEKEVSGACVIPNTVDPVPVVGYLHGTIFHNKDAPSQFKSILSMPIEIAMNIIMSSSGFVCAAPDYIGYGADSGSLHPYHLADSLATASIDMLRAVKEMCAELDVNIKNEYFLTGYSEGGYATLAVQKKIEAQYAAEFPLIAVSAGAGAYNLLATIGDFLSRPTLNDPAYVCFLYSAYRSFYGWDRAYSSVFREPYAGRMQDGLFNGDYTHSQINGQLTHIVADLFKAAFISDFNGSGEQTIKNALRENKLFKGWTPSTPLRLYHGAADKTVPPFNSEHAENAFISGGATDVDYISYPGLNHSSCIIPWAIGTVWWFLSF
jgi:hypothetical protein